MKMYLLTLICAFFFWSCGSDKNEAAPIEEPTTEVPEPLDIGLALSVTRITPEKMTYAKSVGVDFVEASGMNGFFDANRKFIKTDAEATAIMQKAKKAADDAGVKIWSIHMAYSAHMDLSTINEEDRKQVVAMHIKLLDYLKILEPEIILFHPSYYLQPNERDMRKSQMIKSAKELDVAVRAINATMVIENMLGPELEASGGRERPLMRTVEETVEIFKRLPKTIYSAIDLNHIKNPEELIRAMGNRLKTIHVADGTGRAENHWFPCSGQGENDWVEILTALDEVGYTGPFMYETSQYEDEKDLLECYESLYDKFIDKAYKR